MRVLVTGASGFLGWHVCRRLLAEGHLVRALTRGPMALAQVEVFRYDDCELRTPPPAALEDVDAVVHLSARVHVHGGGTAFRAAFYDANMAATCRLAAMAAAAGVRDFLFASSVKAAADTAPEILRETDPPRPRDPYGASKLEAEVRLAEIGAAQHMNTVSLRLPLMYGARMKANMLALFRTVDRGLPLPLGGIENRRSVLYAGNAAAIFSWLSGCIDGQELYYASDGAALSTPELVRQIGAALNRPVRLVPAPTPLLRLAARLDLPIVGAAASRLAGSLAVDPSRLLGRLGRPLPYTLEDGLAHTAAWYRESAAGARHPDSDPDVQ